ncbi:double-strand break repair helicase AddA [Roseobacter sp. CCS2]|uniref:double-strand break repair helicase AddA n=1 Tax=Roseobacter sp. CCS2 TaxID=391593 RepID=UPI0000F4051F|nr:double-strand break repair helicase AddA [Roseobacter sp. CCS2]EBA14118.1 ATP-dependent DNA helicase, UvrD/Rep family protein [Roseobacter sp. CCS2]
MIRDAATQRQVDAADPRISTWLSANAGSGKTRVLTDRVARLLLEEVSPQNILCLTYTKAAAAEMQNRLFQRLGAWAMMSDTELSAELLALGVDRQIDSSQLSQARTLFARAIETPGGLKIQTIHSFCAGVLRRFPLEAQVSPQFREMEDRAAQILRAEVVDEMVMGPQANVVHSLLAHFTGSELDQFTAEIAGKREYFLQKPDRNAISETLNIPQGITVENLLDDVFDKGLLLQLANACASGSANDIKAANALRSILDYPHSPHDVLAVLESVFLTGEGAKAPFTAKIGTFPTKATRAAHEDLMADIEPLMGRVEDMRPHRLGLLALDRTMALYDFANVFVPAYEARKLAMGALDFDDLIRKAKALLTDRDVAQWVLFRLDGGIDHILVDEAQDTSPTQWAVIEQLTQEFATGEGARMDRERTVFVVGDKKQSIYSFQGADPAAFDQMKTHFRDAHQAISKPFEVTSLDHSFRSSQAILSVVDQTFIEDRAAGMDDSLTHIAFKENMPGRVDLWPVIEKSKVEDNREWFKPVDEPSATDHTVLMAQRVAEQIRYMIAHETIPEEVGNTGAYNRRSITEGDFLILVQRRSELFAEIIRACKAADLKIAGADRLRVGAELAVKDLAAVLSFLALPEDDLSLASALRSPLFGWSEQDLFTLAHHRPKNSFLWEALRNSDHNETLAILNDLRGKSDFLRPYDLIERILTRHDGRRKLLARLGPEAEDGIDALLSQALAYESTGVPSLTGFLTWMETDDLEVKRQMESQGDRIRVMTVHGAKGLEAPIVILPDTAKRDVKVNQELLPADDHVIWKTPAKSSAPSVIALRDKVIAKQARERMRLLYVAMTRAEKWLIAGAAGDIGEGDASWYNLVADGMDRRGAYDAALGDMPLRRVSELDWDAPDLVTTDAKPDTIVAPPQFGALPIPKATKTIAPSELPGDKIMKGDPAGDDIDDAKARGTQIHLLLEHLPMAAEEQRHELGLQLLQTDDPALVDDVIALIKKPELGWLWNANALTEVVITADIPQLGRVHGAIDRLIIGPDTITAIDYKSNRLVPSTPEDTPIGLQRQLAAYDYALREIYPDHQITTAILWTHTGTLTVLPQQHLHEALNSLATS